VSKGEGKEEEDGAGKAELEVWDGGKKGKKVRGGGTLRENGVR